MLDVILIIVSALCMIAGLAGLCASVPPRSSHSIFGIGISSFTDKGTLYFDTVDNLAVDCSRGAGAGLLYSDAWK